MKTLRTARDADRRAVALYLAVFLACVIGLGWIGYFAYRSFEQNLWVQTETKLAVIADAKVSLVQEWRMNRLGAGELFFKNHAYYNLTRRYLAHPEDADLRRQMQAWLEKIRLHDRYDVVRLIGLQGATLLSQPEQATAIADALTDKIPEALKSGQVVVEDFYRNNADHRIYLAVLVPILDDTETGRPLGVLTLRVDPEEYLFPSLRLWPTPSATGETLLIRREGNEAVVLNELRSKTNTALNLHFPLNQTNQPIVQAVLGGTGPTQGESYRGTPCLAHLRAVPDSPWFLMTGMDRSESERALATHRWQLTQKIAATLTCVAALLALLWRQRRARILHESAEAVRASEERYRRLFESAQDGILILDGATGKIVEVNPFLVQLLQISHEALIGKQVWELGFFKDIAASEAKFAELQAKEYVRYEDLPLETAAGVGIEVEFVSNVYLVNNQRVIQCNIRDITARKRAEEAHARLALAVAQIAETVMITDPAGALVFINPVFEKVSGYAPAEALGQNPRMLKSGKHAAEFYQQMWAQLAAGKPWQGHLINRRKDGSFYEEEAIITPVLGATGKIVNYVAVKRDVTAAMELEAQRRQYEKMEALGRMAGAIAHHFNNKLQAVIGNLELLRQESPQDEHATRSLGDAMHAAGEAAKISGLMLTYLGQAPHESKPLDLAELCRRSLPLLRATIPMVLETDLPTPGPLVNANANQVQQLLINLLTNAWEASRTNQGSVTVSVKVVEAKEISGVHRFPSDWHPHAQSYACLAVRDAGSGIAAPDIDKLFDPFFSTKFTGRGLGLAVVFGTIRSHAGVITVDSALGQGSVFRAFFPILAPTAPHPTVVAEPAPPLTVAGTVLVVEDDAALLKLTAHYLHVLGFTVLAAPDGVVALDLFRQHQADIRCVLSDVVMPHMDGWQTLEALRQLAPGLPVILASGYDEATVMGGEHAEKPQAFLSKPYTREELRAALGRVLGTQP